ncbi:hypothetical protein A11Q_1603 [Pseudobdellovibrio exovorus JSS]|uniref:Uncharacterized protein n=1 Tax=Pseudobdellovibrio exovorus JSS TaxID=1184267 RepID=M4VRK9_9BACT|nr:hypothetical protein A11Q_1603 [Pseudobdellovibrio exovorus JSS]
MDTKNRYSKEVIDTLNSRFWDGESLRSVDELKQNIKKIISANISCDHAEFKFMLDQYWT